VVTDINACLNFNRKVYALTEVRHNVWSELKMPQVADKPSFTVSVTAVNSINSSSNLE
jgi:hypothetical protein